MHSLLAQVHHVTHVAVKGLSKMYATPQARRSPVVGGRISAHSAATTRRGLHATTNSPLTVKQPFRAEQVLEETDLHLVKAKNSPVPVQVQETLRTDLQGITLKLHYSGWAWLVCDSRVYFWKHSVKQASTSCHQLPLPTSMTVTGWSADLVTVHPLLEHSPSVSKEIQGVLTVSPEGLVRYWKGWADDQPHSEARIDVGSDRIQCVTNLETSVGFVVVAGNASFYIVKSPQRSQPMTITHLDTTRGMFSGIGRRVSSMFWGGHHSETRETVCIAACFMELFACDIVYVMTRTHLQRWKVDLCRDRGETLMQYEISLSEFIRDSVVHALWFPQEGGVLSVPESDLRLWPLDCTLTSKGVAVLFAVSHYKSQAPVLKYGIACISMDNEVTPLGCSHTPYLLHDQPYQAGEEPVLPDMKIVGHHELMQVAVYDRHRLFPVHLKRAHHIGQPSLMIKPDRIDFPSPNGIIGVGTFLHELLFFTVTHGVVSLMTFSQSNDAFSAAKKAKPYSTPSLLSHPRTPSSHAPPPIVAAVPADNIADETEQLKNSFMLYLQNGLAESASQCAHHFPGSSFGTCLDTPGDLAALRLSEMVLNDLPTADPRCHDDRPSEVSGIPSSSMIILYQLQDKLKAHNHYIQFLTDVGLLDKLTCCSARGKVILTRHLLCEHAEKIMAAIALRQGGREDMKERKVMAYECVEQAIKKVLQQRPPLPYLRPGLGTQDIFFSQVATVDQILVPLLNCEENKLMSNIPLTDKLKLALSVASVLESMLHEVAQYRMSKAILYSSCVAPDFVELEYCPWSGENEVRDIVSGQLQLLIDTWVESCRELTVTDQDSRDMWVLYMDLAAILFEGFREQLASIRTERAGEVRKMFEKHLEMFIPPLLDQNQLALAAQLAERYEHFPTLVHLCEKLENMEQLQDYFKRFSGKGFADYLFKHYLDQGKLKKLLSFSDFFPQELAEFLKSHPYLSWLHYFATQEYSKAADCLSEQAEFEQQFVSRKTTLLSLSKLCILASDSPDIDKLSAIDSQLREVGYQKNIPVESLEQMGYEPGNEPPLSTHKIVELYVGDSNLESDVIHFLFALEFLDVAFPDRDDPESRDLRLYIWSQAVMKNDWSQLSTDDPLEQLRQTFFFCVVEEAYNRDLDVMKMLPALSDLLHCSYLQPVGYAKTASFHFLMQAGYEQVQRAHRAHTIENEPSP